MLAQDLPIKDQEEEQLPNLLKRHVRHCKTAEGSKRPKCIGPQRDTLSELRKLESSKSLVANRRYPWRYGYEQQKEMSQGQWGHTLSAPNERVFPVKPAPMVRWRAAARIQAHLKKWRSSMASKPSQFNEIAGEPSAPSSGPPNQLWPEEPALPTQEDIEALTTLEALLLEHHGSLEAAFKYITNCVKDATGFSKRKLKIALNLKSSKKGEPQKLESESLVSFDHMYDSLLALLRKNGADEVPRAEFLRFPDLLKREKDLQSRLLVSHRGWGCLVIRTTGDGELLIGSRLQQRLAGRLHSAGEALELLEKVSVALQVEPGRTANLICQIDGPVATPSDALASGIRSIMRIIHEFGAPNTGMKFDVLIAGWTLCNALTKQVRSLVAQSEQQSPVKPCQNKTTSKLTKITCKFKIKHSARVEVAPLPCGSDCEINAALWRALPPGEVLWNLGCGAEVLDDHDFKTLLRTSWSLFDGCDVAGHLLGPVGLGRLRPRLDSLADLILEPEVLKRDPEHAHVQLGNAGVLLQQITCMVEADPRLARIAALFGTSYLANRIRSTANSFVNLVEGSAGSAAAQVNRSASAVAEAMSQDVEELMGGRRVQVCFTSGQYTIKPATAVSNPLATQLQHIHYYITAQVMEHATAKPTEKFLLDCNNLN